MILSERGAIRSAIADGGLHLYPAGNLMELILKELSGDDLRGDFDPAKTIEKLSAIIGPSGELARELFHCDMEVVIDRLEVMEPTYNIEKIFSTMAELLPMLAKQYYGIENFEPVIPQVVEYYFEGFNELYRDGDWFAFNVNRAESKELGVPVGTYFKRDQIAPGHPELTTLHEANHAMQDAAGLADTMHHYIPWFDEGFADAIGRMMLYRATKNDGLLAKVKNFRTEVEVTDPRKVTYHYGEETAALILLRGRLPFFRALMAARKRDPFKIDWDGFAKLIKSGIDPHIAIIQSYIGGKRGVFQKKFEREEMKFRKEGDLDQGDIRVLTMFLATQSPASLPAEDYAAAIWLRDAAVNARERFFFDPKAIPLNLRSTIPDWNSEKLVPGGSITDAVWKKVKGLSIKALIPEEDIPDHLRDGVAKLASMYFILKREIGDVVVYEPYGGGLPYRLDTGEVRCVY